MFKRDEYLNTINVNRDVPQLKLLTGIRHGGKSSILAQFAGTLKEEGVQENHIINFDMSNPDFSSVKNVTEIENIVSKSTKERGKYYLILDEIHSLRNWQKAVNTFCSNKKFDIYVGNSSAKWVSDKSPAALGNINKHIKINVKPMSFYEYVSNSKTDMVRGQGLLRCAISIRESDGRQFVNYVLYGGFPAVLQEDENEKSLRLKCIYDSIISEDLVEKNKINNVDLLKHIIKYIFENLGHENSAKKIKTHLLEISVTKDLSLIGKYLSYLEDAYLLKRIYRYNITSGKLLRSSVQYFLEDHSLVYPVVEINDELRFGVLKNIVLNDFLRRKYYVWSGKFFKHIIDFVAMTHEKIVFAQLVYGKFLFKEQLDEKQKALAELNAVINDYVDHPQMAMYIIFADHETAEQVADTGVVNIRNISIEDFLLLKNI
ncbi:MAG: ATP-binding protein [Termitinemataceae bacterium]|nr:MAG: ATP-binding protein [Termitinemataceae bacterium]